MIQQIKNKEDLALALTEIDVLWSAEKDTKEGDSLNLLISLVHDYEDSLIIEERKNQPEVDIKIDDL